MYGVNLSTGILDIYACRSGNRSLPPHQNLWCGGLWQFVLDDGSKTLVEIYTLSFSKSIKIMSFPLAVKTFKKMDSDKPKKV